MEKQNKSELANQRQPLISYSITVNRLLQVVQERKIIVQEKCILC